MRGTVVGWLILALAGCSGQEGEELTDSVSDSPGDDDDDHTGDADTDTDSDTDTDTDSDTDTDTDADTDTDTDADTGPAVAPTGDTATSRPG